MPHYKSKNMAYNLLKGKKGIYNNPKEALMHATNYIQALNQNKAIGKTNVNMPSDPTKQNAEKMGKSMTAGSGMASPGTLNGGAALGKESLDKKLKKSKWLARAEEEYNSWSKKEAFEDYMAKSMPHLTKGEIKAIGQTLCLSKSLKKEKRLAKMVDGTNLNSWIEKKEKK